MKKQSDYESKKTLKHFKDALGHLKKVDKKSIKGFISAPTLEQLKPTKDERAKLKLLWAWQEASKHSSFMWP